MNRQQIVDHLPGLRRYARALTSDAWAADDLLQDTLERACSKWRLWLAGSDLRAWLFTLMHNLFVSQVRSGKAQRLSAVDADDALRDMAAPAAPLDASIDLQRCLLKLPEDQRVVLLLITLEDMSYAQVAKITGTPIGTVMSRLSRARERMRELMDEPKATQQTPALRRMK
jgi:RNA polymerase sigma factor (sigma-70 family)